MMESESRGLGGAVSETVTSAVANNTDLSGLVHIAEIVVVPTLAPETTPLPVDRPDVMNATDGMLEVHARWGELVRSAVIPAVPKVPIALN
jgi:hypothetical protein